MGGGGSKAKAKGARSLDTRNVLDKEPRTFLSTSQVKDLQQMFNALLPKTPQQQQAAKGKKKQAKKAVEVVGEPPPLLDAELVLQMPEFQGSPVPLLLLQGLSRTSSESVNASRLSFETFCDLWALASARTPVPFSLRAHVLMSALDSDGDGQLSVADVARLLGHVRSLPASDRGIVRSAEALVSAAFHRVPATAEQVRDFKEREAVARAAEQRSKDASERGRQQGGGKLAATAAEESSDSASAPVSLAMSLDQFQVALAADGVWRLLFLVP